MRAGPAILAVLLAGLASPARAQAPQPLYRLRSQGYACANPRAALALTNRADPRQADPGWVAFVFTDGGCEAVSPRSQWRLVFREGDLAFMTYAGTVGAPGPFYMRFDELVEAAPPAAQPSPRQPEAQPAAPATQPPAVPAPAAAPSPQPASPAGLPPPVTTGPSRLDAPRQLPQPATPPPGRGEPAVATQVARNDRAATASPQAAAPASSSGGGVPLAVLAIAGVLLLLWRRGGKSSAAAPLRARAEPMPRPVTRSPPPQPVSERQSRPAPQIPARWIPPGSDVTVAGLRIPCGMVYVGELSCDAPPDALALAALVEDRVLEKFDGVLDERMQCLAYASERIDAAALPELAGALLARWTPQGDGRAG